MPKVSIITPTYNRSKTLSTTIDSVLNQTLDDFEYIIVDDGSTDDTEQVVCQYDDDRITYIQFEANKGANVARNEGIDRASGDFITFLDSDDRYTNDRIDRTISKLESLDDEFCGVTHTFVSEIDGEVVRKPSVPEGRITLCDVLSKNPIGGFSNVMFRKEIFKEAGYLDPEMPSCQDHEFYIRALECADMFGINEVLCRKQKRADLGSHERISNNLDRKVAGQNLLLRKHGDKLSNRFHGVIFYTRGRLHMADGNLREGRKCFAKSISKYPYHPIYYYNLLWSIFGVKSYNLGQNIKRKFEVIVK